MAYEDNSFNTMSYVQVGANIKPTEIIFKDFEITTGLNIGDVVGSGNLTVFCNGVRGGLNTPVYKLSATLPVSDPPTIENNGSIKKYYANLGDSYSKQFDTYRVPDNNMCGTDDGLSLFGISILPHIILQHGSWHYCFFLEMDYYGGSGNGVMNTILMGGSGNAIA